MRLQTGDLVRWKDDDDLAIVVGRASREGRKMLIPVRWIHGEYENQVTKAEMVMFELVQRALTNP